MNRIAGTRMLVAGVVVAAGWMPLAGQAPRAGGQPPVAGPGGGGRGGPPQLIDLATAKRGVDAAEAACTAANVKVSIAVVDANGDLVYFRRMDGAISPGVVSSQGKARTAILFGVPTKAVAESAAAGTPITATVTPGGVGTTSTLTILQGGVPIIKNGKVIGGIAAGGSTTTNDEMCAKAGLDAMLK